MSSSRRKLRSSASCVIVSSFPSTTFFVASSSPTSFAFFNQHVRKRATLPYGLIGDLRICVACVAVCVACGRVVKRHVIVLRRMRLVLRRLRRRCVGDFRPGFDEGDEGVLVYQPFAAG